MVEASPHGGPGGSRRRSLSAAALQTYAVSLAGAALSLLNVLVVSRALGPGGRGDIAFLTAMAYLTAALSAFGVQEAIANLAGTDAHLRPSLATNAAVLAAVFGGLAAVVLAILFTLVPASSGGASHSLLVLALATIPFLILQEFLRYLVQADYGFTVANVAMLSPIVVNLVGNGGMALLGMLTVATAFCTWIAGQLLAVVVLAWYVRSHLSGFGRPDFSLARRSLAFGVKSHLGRVMLLGNYRLDIWILAAFASSTEVGLYSVAVAWAEALYFLPTALAAVQRPDLVRASLQEAGLLASRLFRISILVTTGLVVALIVLAPFLCAGIFGDEFEGSIRQLRVLALGAFGIVALKQLGTALTAQRLPLHAGIGIGAGFVATLILDFALIPSHGGFGAAMASAIAYTIGGTVGVVVFTRAFGRRSADLAPHPTDVPDMAALLRGAIRR